MGFSSLSIPMCMHWNAHVNKFLLFLIKKKRHMKGEVMKVKIGSSWRKHKILLPPEFKLFQADLLLTLKSSFSSPALSLWGMYCFCLCFYHKWQQLSCYPLREAYVTAVSRVEFSFLAWGNLRWNKTSGIICKGLWNKLKSIIVYG